MWRQEDVWYALGGGIDAYTSEPLDDEYGQSKQAAQSAAPLISLCCPPLMHGAAQWGTLRSLFEGNTAGVHPQFSAEEVWRLVEREHVATLSITGDAMARPLIEGSTRNPDTYDVSSLVAVASSAAVFTPSVKARFFDRFPNLILVDAIGSTESGPQRHRHGERRRRAQGGHRPHRQGARPGRWCSTTTSCRSSPGPAWSGMLARGGNIPLGYYKDEEKTAATFVDLGRGRALRDPRRLRQGRGRRHASPCSAAARSASTRVARRSTPRRSRARSSRTPPSSTPSSWASPTSAGASRSPRSSSCARAPRPPTLAGLADHCRTTIAGYKVPRRVVVVEEVVRSPSGKPDYPWAKATAEAG